MSRFIDLTGQRFHRWTVVSRATRPSPHTEWNCVCDCGNTRIVPMGNLRNGLSKGCGCNRSEDLTARQTSHGFSKHPAYGAWHNMLSRCRNPNARNYPGYGGRGIKVCEAWNDWRQFWADMGPTWREDLSLERKDVNGDYEPGNCRWATFAEQSSNRRTTRIIETPDGPMTMSQASRKYGLSTTVIRYRIEQNWPLADRFRAPSARKSAYFTRMQ